MKVIAICNLPDGIKLDHAWFTAEDGYYAQKVAIRPLPEKKEMITDLPQLTDSVSGKIARAFIKGYNACLEDVKGET